MWTAPPSPPSLGIDCSTSYVLTKRWLKTHCQVERVNHHSPIRSGGENLFFGVTQFGCALKENKKCLLRASVAADYSDSLPDSSNTIGHSGYHPLEELRDHRRVRETKLTDVETARTVLELNNRALVFFHGTVHHEPHERDSWADLQYIVDLYGDIYFKIYNEQNVFQDRHASNPVRVLFGMDMSEYEARTLNDRYDSDSEIGSLGDMAFQDDYSEAEESEMLELQDKLRILNSFNSVHPIYFARCLTKKWVGGNNQCHQIQNKEEWKVAFPGKYICKNEALIMLEKAVDSEHAKIMDNPKNGVAIFGHLKPAYIDDKSYVHLFTDEYMDGYTSDLTDEEMQDYAAIGQGSYRSIIYRLEVFSVSLYTVYGDQVLAVLRESALTFDCNLESFTSLNGCADSVIDVDDFVEAVPDELVNSIPEIINKFHKQGLTCNLALRALCKKKGLVVEEASLIGVDSLGMDVRVFSGREVQTHRFPFKSRATSKADAMKQIQHLLFPKSHRKKLRIHEKLDNDELI